MVSKASSGMKKKAAIAPLEGEVIVFNDPTIRPDGGQQRQRHDEGGSRDGKVKPAVTGAKPVMAKRVLDASDIEGSSRKITEQLLKEVEEFNASHLEGHDRKKYQRQKMLELGALPSKPQKIPYKILKGMNQLKKFREKVTRERQIENGTYVKKKVAKAPREKRKEGDRELKASTGKFIGGVLYVNKKKLL